MSKGDVMRRWFNVWMAIQAGRTYTSQELARRTDVSTRTIYRDLKGMQEAGVPIYFDEAKRTYRLTENFQMRPLHFTTDELNSLIGALNFMRHAGPGRSRKSIDALMDKVMAGLTQSQRQEADELERNIVIDPVGARSVEDERVVQALEQSLSQRRKVAIRYAAMARGGEEAERTVQPYGLVYRGASLYLIGFCELRRDVRTFRLGRIHQIQLLADRYTIPEAFDLNEYLSGLWGITEGPETRVRLRFDAPVAQLALETQWHPTQVNEPQADGSVVVTMTTRGPAELSRWLVGYGGTVHVLAPVTLKEAVLQLAVGVQEAYREEE